MDTDTGPADYMLFVDGKACGILEAKREGADLGGVAEQSARYATSHTQHIVRWVPEDQPLPFLFEATNHEIRFRDERDPHPRSRYVFHFHRPETLKVWLEEDNTLRARLQDLPELNTENLRACQIDAIKGIEHSLKQGKPRALLQMATGSGKTYAAVTQVYRLAKFAKIKRVLFLVDRGNLATNAKDEFEQFVIPHDGRKFTQHYNVNILGRAGIPDATKVTISTIQRLYSQLTNSELDDEADEHSGFEIEGSTIKKEPRPVSYNPNIPIEEFDVIIIDECHRSIYNLWRQVLEYFDAFLIGLTATPTKKTIGFFGQNLVSEYTHEDAVVDKVNVGYDIYRIKTELTEQGNKIEAGTAVEIRDRLTKQKRLEVLDQEEEWLAQQLEQFKAKGKMPKNDTWKEKYKEPEHPDVQDLPELANEWQYVRLDALAEIQGGLTVDSKRKKAKTKRLPYLRVANVQHGYLDLSEMKEIDVPEDRVEGLLLKDRDVLFNEGGDRDKLGRGWVWHDEVQPCTYQNHVFRARPYSTEIISEFISIFGNTFGQDYFMRQGKKTTNLASINKTKPSVFPVPLVSKNERDEVMAILDEKLIAINRVEKSVVEQLLKAEKNKQSILASAFSGKV